MSAFSIIPPHESDLFGRLKDNVKLEFGRWADAVLKIAGMERGIGKAIAEYASKLNCSEGHLRRKVDEWRETGDWKVLVNKSLAGNEWWDTDAVPWPDEFVDFWCGKRGENQRGKARPQYDALIRQLAMWRRGDLTRRIPGFDAPPPNAPGYNHPAGWSYRNLMRIKPRRAEMALMTLGVAAAMKLLPPIPGTREGARFLEYITIDDVWQDRKVMVPGYSNPARLLQMGAMDYASAVYLKFGLRPELPLDDGKRERLKERDAKQLVAMLLETFGYPVHYDMHIICERGTATIREADAKALYDLSGGRIKVCYTSMEGGLVLTWMESSTGNSRGKAWHESWHNLFHNEMASLPGQVGKDNAHQPMALLAMEREAKNLVTASHFLTPEQKQRIKMPFSTLEEAHWETLEVVERINHRRKHDCEGFGTVMEWVLPGVDMEPAPEGAVLTLNDALREQVQWRPRLESPMERLMKLRGAECTASPGATAEAAFRKIPSWIMPRFYEDNHALEKITDGRFVARKDGVTYVFKPASPEATLPDTKQKYLGYFKPLNPDFVYLTDEDGAFVGTWIRERKVRRADQEALAEAIAEKTALLNTAMSNVRRYRKDEIAEQERRIRDNVAVMAEAGLIEDSPASLELRAGEVLTPGAAALGAAVQATASAKTVVKEKKADAARLAALASAAMADAEEPALKEE